MQKMGDVRCGQLTHFINKRGHIKRTGTLSLRLARSLQSLSADSAVHRYRANLINSATGLALPCKYHVRFIQKGLE